VSGEGLTTSVVVPELLTEVLAVSLETELVTPELLTEVVEG
jgi:hypothetical protein